MALFTHLELTHFRNFENAELIPAPGLNLIDGSNGSGKTNLLEAFFLLSIGRSLRHARIRETIRFGASEFSARARFQTGDSDHEVRLSGTPDTHAFFLDRERLRSVSELLGQVPIVCFTPEDLTLVSGPPSERRRYLNMLHSQGEISYFITLCEYNRTLQQRNAFLKNNTPNPAYLSVLTDTLIRTGGVLRAKRRTFIETILPLARERLSRISGETLGLQYRPQGSLNAGEAAKELDSEFRKTERQETVRKKTLFGPHLDEMAVESDGVDLRLFGSRGQVRSAVVALKLAAVDYLEQAKGEPCVLLLDDIFSELDLRRSEDLLSALPEGRQVFSAAPETPAFLASRAQARFRVEQGVLTAVERA